MVAVGLSRGVIRALNTNRMHASWGPKRMVEPDRVSQVWGQAMSEQDHGPFLFILFIQSHLGILEPKLEGMDHVALRRYTWIKVCLYRK